MSNLNFDISGNPFHLVTDVYKYSFAIIIENCDGTTTTKSDVNILFNFFFNFG